MAKCDNCSTYAIGEEVTVVASSSVGMMAIMLAFVLPTVLLLVVIVGLLMIGMAEYVAAMVGLLSLIPYYFVLWLSRGKLERKLTFSVIKT